MGYSARRGFTNGKVSGAARQAELQQKIAQMQEQMSQTQEAVEAQEFTASVGGGVVSAKVNGKKELLSVTIKPEAVDPDDVEMLQDLVVSAVNEALRQAGFEVVGMVASYTYGFPQAEEAFKEANVRLITISDYEHTTAIAAQTGYIQESDLNVLAEWRKSPSTWMK